MPKLGLYIFDEREVKNYAGSHSYSCDLDGLEKEYIYLPLNFLLEYPDEVEQVVIHESLHLIDARLSECIGSYSEIPLFSEYFKIGFLWEQKMYPPKYNSTTHKINFGREGFFFPITEQNYLANSVGGHPWDNAREAFASIGTVNLYYSQPKPNALMRFYEALNKTDMRFQAIIKHLSDMVLHPEKYIKLEESSNDKNGEEKRE